MSKVVGYLVGQAREFSGLRVAISETGLVIGRDPKRVDVVFDHTLVSRRVAFSSAGASNGQILMVCALVTARN